MADMDLEPRAVGELAKAIPPDAWNRMVGTACTTFEMIVAPLTELTSGVGRVIHARFDRFTEAERRRPCSSRQRVAAWGGPPYTQVTMPAFEGRVRDRYPASRAGSSSPPRVVPGPVLREG